MHFIESPFRTFYNRVFDDTVPTYVECITEVSPVQTNLSLSLKDIFERWRKNMPLDDIQRNGKFFVKKPLTEAEEDELLDRESEVDCIEDATTELSAIIGASRDATVIEESKQSGDDDDGDISADAQG